MRSSHALADAICGRQGGWARLAALEPAEVMRSATRHGVAPLLASRVPPDLDRDLGARLRAESVRAAARDAITGAALHQLTSAFSRASVEALVFKGADLAYSCYPQSHLRPRIDSDILIAERARATARQVLAHLGYAAVPQSGGDLLMYQEPFVLRDGDRLLHTVDLHWRVANPQQFGEVAPFYDLWAASESRPRRGEAARGLTPIHAFGLACVHRVAHHYDDDRLIWTHDLHQLAQTMHQTDWERLGEWATTHRAATACARGMALAAALFDSAIPADVLAALVGAEAREPNTRRYLANGRHVDRILTDLALMPSWTARAALARQHVFPPARYMRDVYAPGSPLPVPVLYIQRVWRGARRWMAKS